MGCEAGKWTALQGLTPRNKFMGKEQSGEVGIELSPVRGTR